MTFAGPKGQGATEYLVLLAVVLIVAMVAIALLGFFPGLSYDAKKSESDSYWRGASRPFQIKEHSQPANGNLTMVLGNVDPAQLKLTDISVAGGGFAGNYNTTTYISGGEQRTIPIAWTTTGTCASGSVYEYQVNFTYDGTGENAIVNQKQSGVKTLVGKCA